MIRKSHRRSRYRLRRRWPFCRDCRVEDDLLDEDLPPECLQERTDTMPLCMAMAGEVVELVRIQECPRLRKRLADLGLNTGMCVRVIRSSSGGPMILAVKDDSRLGIGRGIANKITVKPQRTRG
jgi:Fe2+ transport system protein FeoA